jgi:hypothetical protein
MIEDRVDLSDQDPDNSASENPTPPDGYKEKVSDENLIRMVADGINNSVGDFLNSANLAQERQKSTYEYGMLPVGHLVPQGVSQIVSSDTVEAVEGYTAILSELLLNNNKIAKFVPSGHTPTAIHQAIVASDVVNYVVFRQNDGWAKLNTWLKSALLWKNSIIRWGFVEDHEYRYHEFESITQEQLDLELAKENVEAVSNLEYEPILDAETATYVNVYKNVRLREKVSRNKIALSTVPPENFRVTRDATCIEDAGYLGVAYEMTRSDIRTYWPDRAEKINWADVGDGALSWATKYAEESAARKLLTGQEYWMNSHSKDIYNTEANTPITVVESWFKVDRDGDGIAELKRFITAGSVILLEEDCDFVPMASLCPFEVPHEFLGLSVADIARPSTLASTAILRGFIENVYLTNYSPKLADPNVVDFSALQNMKPKQLIPTNGNPTNAVANLSPDTISTGTVPLLEALQQHKEQAHGLSKAAQGLNDTLYVSGNSEEKLQRVMTASQVRLQYVARRLVETGFKRLVEGIYRMIRKQLAGQQFQYYDHNDFLKSVNPADLPEEMNFYVNADVGDHANSSIVKKMNVIGKDILPALKAAGAGGAVNPEAAVRIACKAIEALDLDPLDYLVDYTSEEFKATAQKSRDAEIQAAEAGRKLDADVKQLEIETKRSNLALTNVQTKNAMQDNTRQLLVAMLKQKQEWAKIMISAAKEGVDPKFLPPEPNFVQMLAELQAHVQTDATTPISTPKVEQQQGPAPGMMNPTDVMPASS